MSAREITVENEATLRHVLDLVTFAPSCLDMGWAFQIETVPGRGWLVSTTFRRPDTRTGEIGTGSGRQEFVAIGTSESGVVKTAWLLAELIVRHELMEAFLYDGVRIFDPHRTVAELSLPEQVKPRAAQTVRPPTLDGQTLRVLVEVSEHSYARTGDVARAIAAGLQALETDPAHCRETFTGRHSGTLHEWVSMVSDNGVVPSDRVSAWRDAVRALLEVIAAHEKTPVKP